MKTPLQNKSGKALSNIFDSSKNWMFEHYGENPGKMLVHTGTVGWILSSLAQISAIVTNDKYTKEQKMFMVPQEMADATINILSFYAFTNGIKKLTTKFLKTGKLRNKVTEDILRRDGHILEKGAKRAEGKVYAGDIDFDITKLPNYNSEIKAGVKDFKNGTEVTMSLIGSIISCNIFTPIVRNLWASKKQKQLVEKHNNGTLMTPPYIKQYSSNASQPTIANFTSLSYSKYNGGSLKI